MRRGSDYLDAQISRSNMITTFELHSKGHMHEIQSGRHACFYVAKAEDLNVESSYFLLAYIGISLVELRMFISLHNLTYTRSISAKRKKTSFRECINHETSVFTLMQKSFNSIYFRLHIIQHFLLATIIST